MSSNYSKQNVISMDIYKIMKQLNIDAKDFNLQILTPTYKKTNEPPTDHSK